MCCDSYQSDVPGDETVFHRARFDDQSVGAVPIPKLTVTEDRDRLLSSDPESGLVSVGRFPVLWTNRYRMIPKLGTDHSQRHRTSQVTLVRRPNLPCLGSVNRTLVIFPVLWRPRYRMIPKLGTDRSQRHRTSQVTSVRRPNLPCLGSVNRTPVICNVLQVCSRVRRDEESSLMAGLDRLVVPVYHPMFGTFDSEFGDVLE